MVSAVACIAPRTLSSAKVFRTASNSILPARPPSTAPSARAVLVLSCSFTPSFLPLTRELIDMPNTVQPEQKLTVDTGKIPSISKSGLMMIPPPAPTIEPILDARIQTIKRIKGIIENLCKKYGERITDDFYTFPTAEKLSTLTVADFEALGTGYRAKYLEKLSKDVANGKIDLEKIKALPLDEARSELLKIYGVGIKVANCALLFGFGFYDAFPVDVWMKRVMEYYPNGLPKCFEGIGGIAQQYLFHWARNNL